MLPLPLTFFNVKPFWFSRTSVEIIVGPEIRSSDPMTAVRGALDWTEPLLEMPIGCPSMLKAPAVVANRSEPTSMPPAKSWMVLGRVCPANTTAAPVDGATPPPQLAPSLQLLLVPSPVQVTPAPAISPASAIAEAAKSAAGASFPVRRWHDMDSLPLGDWQQYRGWTAIR